MVFHMEGLPFSDMFVSPMKSELPREPVPMDTLLWLPWPAWFTSCIPVLSMAMDAA